MVFGNTGAIAPHAMAGARRPTSIRFWTASSFVTDRSHWGMYFRKSLFKVSEGDFALIADAMGVGDAIQIETIGVPMSGTLVLVRHGQSEWNLKNLFTGWRDVDLTELGHAEAKAARPRS